MGIESKWHVTLSQCGSVDDYVDDNFCFCERIPFLLRAPGRRPKLCHGLLMDPWTNEHGHVDPCIPTAPAGPRLP